MKLLRKSLIVAVVTAAAVAVAVPAQAVSLTTLFDYNNSHTGNMFDVTVFANDLTITSLEVSLEDGAYTDIDVYIRLGSYVGFEENAAAWTMVSTTADVASAGVNNPTFVDVSDFTLSAGTVYGMYITASTYGVMNYSTTGIGAAVATYANTDLQLDMGAGIGFPSFTEVYSPRTWNGTITYTGGADDPIPEPGTLALFGFGLAAGAGALRRRFGK